MQKLAEICIRRPVFASVLILFLTVVGCFGYLKLGVDQYPEVDFPFVSVTTALPGAAPEEIETEVTERLEEAVNTVSGIEELRSVSVEGVSMLMIQFVVEKDPDVAAQEIRDRVNRARSLLPDDIDDPVVEKLDLDAAPILSIALSADASLRDISEFADKVLRRRLESTNGVGQVSILGAQERQINVLVDPYRLRAEGLNINDVANALRRENAQLPGGTIKQGSEEYTLRTLGRVEDVASLKNLTVKKSGERTITLQEIATIDDGVIEQETIAELNGKPTVLLEIRKQSKTNTVAVTEAVKERLEEEKALLPDSYNLQIVRDQSIFIRASAHAVQEHLILGSIFAAIVVLFFLANWRATLISAVAIPTSIISTFGLMWMMDFTLNQITLLALTLSVGIVVDDAIVVLENIYKYIDEKGYNPFDAAVHATREIGLAVLSITLSLIAVFLPIAFMEGIVGKYMASFGITMSFAIGVSLIVSFTLTPMMSARMLRSHKKKTTESSHENPDKAKSQSSNWKKYLNPYNIIESAYMAMLRICLRHRWIIILVCFAALGSVPFLIQKVNKNFLPVDDQSQFQVSIRAPEGTSLESTHLIVSRIARKIQDYNGVNYTVASVGNSNASNNGSIFVKLVPVHERSFDQFAMMDLVREKVLPDFKVLNLRTSVAPDDGGGFGSGRNADVMYVVSGPEMDKLQTYSEQIAKQLKNIPGALDVDTSLVVGKPQYGVYINREKAADLGVNVTDIASTLRLLVAGDDVSSYDEGGERYDVNLRGLPNYRNDPNFLNLITIPNNRQESIPITDVVNFVAGDGPSEINRLNRRRQVTVFADVAPGGSQQQIIDAAEAEMKKLNLESGYSAGLAGRSKELAKSANAFFLVFLMSLAFMYLIIAAQFESWLNPFIILLSLPLTLPFALISVLITNDSLNIFSMLGVLVLFAVVKKNSILQIDHTNQLRERGMERDKAILLANKDRLRPILMTTIAFVAGMLPLAFSTGEGAATNRTISYVVIGGQTLSLLLTLLAIPVAYSLFDDMANSRIWKFISGIFGKVLSNGYSPKTDQTTEEIHP